MASGVGTAVLDFGGLPGSVTASVAVADALVSSGSKCEAYFVYSASADHTDYDHGMLSMVAGLSCGGVTAGVGFTIYCFSSVRLYGKFVVDWVWSD